MVAATPATPAATVAGARPAPRALSRAAYALAGPGALAVLWLIVVAYAVRFALFKLPVPPGFTDFNHYYVAALTLRQGSNPYRDRFDAPARKLGLSLSGLDLANQPPTMLLCFEPLTRLSPSAAYRIWVAISFAALIAAVYILLGETSLDPRQRLLFAALLFLYPPVYEHFYFANMQILVSLLLVLAIRCLVRGDDRGAGLWLALATSLKAYPALLALYLVARRRWPTLLWMTIWGAAIGLLTLWGLGRVSFSFLGTFGYTSSRQFIEIPGFFSINSIVSRLFWRDGAALSPSADALRVAAVIAVELALAAFTIAATADSAPDRHGRAFALWVPAMMLLSPIAEPHYLVMLMIPFACIADAAARGEAGAGVIYAALASYLFAFSRYPLALLHHYISSTSLFFRIGNQFWFLCPAFAYAAACRLNCATHSSVNASSSDDSDRSAQALAERATR